MSMAKVAENPSYFVAAARAIPVIDEFPARAQHRPTRMESHNAFRQGLQNVLARKRMGSVLIYTMGALILAILCSVVFSLLGQDTQFAISIMGSLIGGFLGALLAAALIVDMYSPSSDRNQEQDGK